MKAITKILQEQWTSQNDIAYKTASKWIRRDYDCTGARAQWLTGGSGGDTLEDITQTVICHAWELFVNGSIVDPEAPLADRSKAAIGVAIKRVVKQGRLFRPADRNPTAGHREACRGRLNRTTYEAHEGGYDSHDMVSPGIAWGEDRDDSKAYRVPENRDALDRLTSRITAANCHRHTADDCRTYRKIIAALITSDGNVVKAAEAMDMPRTTLEYRLNHVADALRQVLAIDEVELSRETVERQDHVQTRCYQQTNQSTDGSVEWLTNLVQPTASQTGGTHDWTRPGSNRYTGFTGRELVDADKLAELTD